MNIHDYIEKLRRKPTRERERIAIIATGVSFAVILVIWILSFSEMNNSQPQESPPAGESASQLEDIGNSLGEESASIEEMLQSLDEEGMVEEAEQETGAVPGEQSQDNDGGQNQEAAPDASGDQGGVHNSLQNSQNNQPTIPPLP